MTNSEFFIYFIWEWERVVKRLRESGKDLSKITIVRKESEGNEL